MEVVVLHVYAHDNHVLVCSHGADDPERFACATDSLALDLSEPTGRAHAAWWLAARLDEDAVHRAIAEHVFGDGWYHNEPDIIDLFAAWTSGRDLSAAAVDALRRVVLAVAGLEVNDG